MALVSITEAARLVSRGRATLYRDIKSGRLSKSVSSTGETAVETSELVRAYGQLNLTETSTASHETNAAKSIEEFEKLTDTWDTSHSSPKLSHDTSGDKEKLAVLQLKLEQAEEKIALLKTIAALEKESRVLATTSLTARLVDKDAVVKMLEGQILRLTYETPVGPVEPARPAEAVEPVKKKSSLFRRLFNG